MSIPMDIKIEFEPTTLALLRRYRDSDLAPGLSRAIKRGMDKGHLLAVTMIQRARFSGKGPFEPSKGKLGVVSGVLRRSIDATPATIDNESRLVVSAELGSNVDGNEPVEYFNAHEFGSTETVRVRAHKRGESKVKAHTRVMNTPERAPLRRGLQDRSVQNVYIDEIEGELVDFLEGKGVL